MTTDTITNAGVLPAGQTTSKPRFATILLGTSMFMTGAAGLVTEYILSTVSTYILGNSIEQFSVVIALMLLMMGIAAWAQQFMSDKFLIEKFIILEVLLALIAGFAPLGIYMAFGYMDSHFALLHYTVVSAIGFMIGFEIPLVMRINRVYSRTLGTNISNVFAPDYVGSFFGMVLWVTVLLKYFPLTESSFMVAGSNFAIAILTFTYFMKHGLVRHKISMLVLIAIAVGAMFMGYSQNRSWSMTLEQKLYDDKIVFATTTKYQRLVMTKSKYGQADEYRFYINGNLQFSSVDEEIYHEQLIHPVMSLVPDHRRVLVLGGGDGLALRELLKYDEVEEILLVDLDPAMTEFCGSNEIMRKLNGDSLLDSRVQTSLGRGVTPGGFSSLFMETDKKDQYGDMETELIADVQIMNVDADKFLSNTTGRWNVIIVDLPDPNSVELAKLYSKEFYQKLRRVLAERGMLVIQSTSPYHAKEAYLCIQRSLEAAGFGSVPYHDNVPSFGDWGFILGWRDQRTQEQVKRQIDRIEFSVETRYLTPEIFQKALVFGKGWLQAEFTHINTMMRPVLLEFYLHEAWKDE